MRIPERLALLVVMSCASTSLAAEQDIQEASEASLRLELDRRALIAQGVRLAREFDESDRDVVDAINSRIAGKTEWTLISAEEAPESVRRWRSSVCAVVQRQPGVLEETDTGYRLRVRPAAFQNVRFRSGLTAKVRATGFLVSPSIVATARHADVVSMGVRDLCFVFDLDGYEGARDGWLELEPHQVVRGSSLKAVAGGADWALIRLAGVALDGEGELRTPFHLSQRLYREMPVHLLGHPLGLPLTYTGPGEVTVTWERNFFTTTLCTHPIDSGSPVIQVLKDSVTRVEWPVVVGVHRGQGHCEPVFDQRTARPVGCEFLAEPLPCKAFVSRFDCMPELLGEFRLTLGRNVSQPVAFRLVMDDEAAGDVALRPGSGMWRVLSPGDSSGLLYLPPGPTRIEYWALEEGHVTSPDSGTVEAGSPYRLDEVDRRNALGPMPRFELKKDKW